MLLPIAGQFAYQSTHELARSALPGAPVTDIAEEPRATTPRARRRLAAVLRRTADRLEPVPH